MCMKTSTMSLRASLLILFCVVAGRVHGHGLMTDPPQRSSLWRYFPGQGFEENYNDNELFCGGLSRQWNQNDGKCGTCGDPYDGERKNEAGGKYATGFIARRYSKGQDIDVEVKLTANHLGFFEFKLCPQNDIKTPVTQECLDRYVLEIVGSPGVTRYEPGSKNGMHHIKLALPAEVTCEQCVLQWHYKAGNNYNCDKVTTECCKGCGPQETFVNCADIAIDDDGSVVPTPKPTTKTTPQQTTPKWTTPSPPTTPIQAETTTKDLGPHVTSCANDELLDCIGVGVYESLNYESWCNTYCSAGRPVCTPELCRCNCKKKVTCFAIGDYEDIPGLDDWCTDTCQYGCASFSHICSCN